MHVTVLPQARIRYGYACPSMSRRGGTRLHPVRDGKINMEAGLQYLRTRDYMGQKLRDHVHPKTGMYSHSTSVAESAPLNPAGTEHMKPSVSGVPTGQLKLLPAKVVTGEAGNRVYLTETGAVIRTTDMGEAPVVARPKNSGVVGTPKRVKREGTVSTNTPKRATVPGGSGAHGRITDEDVRAYVVAAAARRGVVLTVVTPTQMSAGREALKLARKQAEQLFAREARSSSSKSGK